MTWTFCSLVGYITKWAVVYIIVYYPCVIIKIIRELYSLMHIFGMKTTFHIFFMSHYIYCMRESIFNLMTACFSLHWRTFTLYIIFQIILTIKKNLIKQVLSLMVLKFGMLIIYVKSTKLDSEDETMPNVLTISQSDFDANSENYWPFYRDTSILEKFSNLAKVTELARTCKN